MKIYLATPWSILSECRFKQSNKWTCNYVINKTRVLYLKLCWKIWNLCLPPLWLSLPKDIMSILVYQMSINIDQILILYTCFQKAKSQNFLKVSNISQKREKSSARKIRFCQKENNKGLTRNLEILNLGWNNWNLGK